MEYYLGIDGGGTKTRFCLADGKGKILHSYQTTGVSYRQYSIDTVRARLLEGTNNVYPRKELQSMRCRLYAWDIHAMGKARRRTKY